LVPHVRVIAEGKAIQRSQQGTYRGFSDTTDLLRGSSVMMQVAYDIGGPMMPSAKAIRSELVCPPVADHKVTIMFDVFHSISRHFH
jgi:hypothetical protein